jgi:hypothetical protein
LSRSDMFGSWWVGLQTAVQSGEAFPHAHQTQRPMALFPVNFFDALA